MICHYSHFLLLHALFSFSLCRYLSISYNISHSWEIPISQCPPVRLYLFYTDVLFFIHDFGSFYIFSYFVDTYCQWFIKFIRVSKPSTLACSFSLLDVFYFNWFILKLFSSFHFIWFEFFIIFLVFKNEVLNSWFWVFLFSFKYIFLML